MHNLGLSLLLHALFTIALLALLVFFRHDGADMDVWTRGAMSIQLLCYWLIIAGWVLVNRWPPPEEQP